MSTAAEILVIITSIILIVFLIIAIILIVLVINVTRKIKKVADSGEAIAQNIERATKGIGRGIGRAGTPLLFLNLLRGFTSNKSKGTTSKRNK